MSRLFFHRSSVLIHCASALFLLYSASGSAVADVLSPPAMAAFEKCINSGPATVCVSETAPAGVNMLNNCALSFCDVAQSNKLLDRENAEKLVAEILKDVEAVRINGGSTEGSAAGLIASIKTLQGQLGNNHAFDANQWAESDQSNPIQSGYGELRKRCEALKESDSTGWSKRCVAEAIDLLALRFSSEAIRRTVQRLHWALVEKSVACQERILKHYDAYFDESRFQWPWELAINSKRGAKAGAPTECEGFKDAPSKQIIFLHPTVGFRYSNQAEQKVDAALLLEVIGIRRWQWQGDEAVKTRGASVVMSYANQKDASSVGWGLMIHLRDDISIGLVRHKSSGDNKISFVFGYEFGKLINNDRTAACAKLFDDNICKRVVKNKD